MIWIIIRFAVGAILTALISYWMAKGDAKEVMKGNYIEGPHYSRGFVRIMLFFILAIFATQGISLAFVGSFICYTSIFGAIFDPAYNHFVGEDFFYHGNQAVYDKMARHAPILFFLAEVVFAISGAVAFFVWI